MLLRSYAQSSRNEFATSGTITMLIGTIYCRKREHALSNCIHCSSCNHGHNVCFKCCCFYSPQVLLMGRKGVPERKPNSPVILIFSRSWKTSGNKSSYLPMSVTGMLRRFPRLPRKGLRHAIDPRPIPRLSATRS